MEIIGSRVGFATPSHFARIFREVFGITPSAYRKQYYASLLEDAAAILDSELAAACVCI